MLFDFRDAARTCVVMATGPSLTAQDATRCRGWPCIVVNDAWRLAPWADLLYAADYDWWQHHASALEDWRGLRCTHAPRSYETLPPGLLTVRGEFGKGLPTDAGLIRYGGSSGQQAMQIACRLGARRIVLLGFDCGAQAGRSHFFGDHPPPLRRPYSQAQWQQAFEALAADLRQRDVQVINAAPSSHLRCWPKAALDTVLAPLAVAA